MPRFVDDLAAKWKLPPAALYGVAVVLIAAIAGGIYYFETGKSPGTSILALDKVSAEVKPDDIVQGSATAPVLIVEYASLACPHCAEENNTVMPKLRDNYIKTGKVRYVLREFPLWAQGRMAAALARCLSGDNFYSFVDLLFANQAKWLSDNGQARSTAESVMDGLAEMGRFAGLSREKVESCVNDPKNLAIVDANTLEAEKRYGVNGTPTFIIDGKVYGREIPYEEMQKILDPIVAK